MLLCTDVQGGHSSVVHRIVPSHGLRELGFLIRLCKATLSILCSCQEKNDSGVVAVKKDESE